jgi:ABC-type phosphate transport system substrate-binding protein
MPGIYHRAYLPLFLITCLWLLPGLARAGGGIAVIVARNAPHMGLNHSLLRDIYLKKIFVDEGGHELVPVNLPPDHPLRRAFSQGLLHVNGNELENYWNEKYFHGVRPPYVLGSQNAVVQFVVSTEGAIGYVAECKVDASVRVIMVLTVPKSLRKDVDRLCGE